MEQQTAGIMAAFVTARRRYRLCSRPPHTTGGGADGALIGGVPLMSTGPHLIKWPGVAIDLPSGTQKSLSALPSIDLMPSVDPRCAIEFPPIPSPVFEQTPTCRCQAEAWRKH